MISNLIIYTFPSNIHHILALQALNISWGLTLRFTVFDIFCRFLLKMTFKQVQLFRWPINIFKFLTQFLKSSLNLLSELCLTLFTISKFWGDMLSWNKPILTKITNQKTSTCDVIMTSLQRHHMLFSYKIEKIYPWSFKCWVDELGILNGYWDIWH